MIEIPRADLKQQSRTEIRSKKKAGISGTAGTKFAAEVENVISSEYAGGIDELMIDLQDQEKRFLDSQSLYELERYKILVKKILKMILEQGFESHKLEPTSREKRLGRAERTIIKQIDENLVGLSRMITVKSDAFGLMKKIEEIRGLIFDLIY
ncbi:MAG TPA: DUF327 family protein [Spirochaetota bacterium]|nr:YaaR family protein [Spirochaetota bacterium]HQO39710.1 DUF327 family protein [Spirochaetota bacterium]